MKKLTLAMIVKNESKHLGLCLASVVDIVDEIIVVDTGSTDNTKEIALSFGAMVFDFQWVNNFSAARNFALKQSSGDWNLVLDADEYIINDCKESIRDFIETQNAIGRIKRIDKFIQDGEEKFALCFISRLMPKETYYTGIIHEQVDSNLERINLPIEVGHDGYVNVGNREDRNLKLLLLALDQNSDDPYMLYQTASQYHLAKQYDLADGYFERCYNVISKLELYKPSMVVRYLYNIVRKGNLEKGLEIIQNEQHELDDFPDFHFVCGIFYMELVYKDHRYVNLFPLIEKEYYRCLELGDNGRYDGVIGSGTFYPLYNLGVLNEVTGNILKAKEFYQRACDYGYSKAVERLKILEGS